MSGEITLEGDSTPVQAPMGFSPGSKSITESEEWRPRPTFSLAPRHNECRRVFGCRTDFGRGEGRSVGPPWRARRSHPFSRFARGSRFGNARRRSHRRPPARRRCGPRPAHRLRLSITSGAGSSLHAGPISGVTQGPASASDHFSTGDTDVAGWPPRPWGALAERGAVATEPPKYPGCSPASSRR
jgi:hypothetical protein